MEELVEGIRWAFGDMLEKENSESDYYGNIMQVFSHAASEDVRRLRKRVQRTEVPGGGAAEALLLGQGVPEKSQCIVNQYNNYYAEEADHNVRCYAYRPETARELIHTGAHSPAKYRVIGSMSNFEEFRKAFDCPAKSPMNRGAESCRVW
ncbi:hypothetical protein CRUP_035384 [Coryphaenoides rupestris]|nr:hypothetical protein CRUP_035384 [Coryphaenoides rupestris]